MKNCKILYVLVLFLFLTACTREASKQRYFERGNLFYKQRDFKNAALAYRKAIQKDDTFGEAYLGFGRAELQLGNPARAVTALQRAIILLPNQEEPKVRLADTLLASYLADPRKPPEVLRRVAELGKSVLDKNANSADGLRLNGQVALLRGDAVMAVTLLRRSNAVSAMRPSVIVPLIQALFRSGQVKEGEDLARAAISQHKTLAAAYDILFLHYMGDKNLMKADALLQEKAANHPGNASVLLQLARFYFSVGKSSQMEAVLQRLRDNPSEFELGRLAVGDFYARIGRPHDAMSEYETGIKVDSKQTIEYQKRMAALLLAKGDQVGAVKLFEAVLRQQPDNLDVLMARATVWSQSANVEQVSAAADEFRSLIGREPDNPILDLHLGRTYMRRGDVPGARAAFEGAVRKQRWFVPARLALTEIGIIEGKYKEALQQVNEALSVDPRNPAARLLKATALTADRSLIQARGELNSLLKDAPGMIESELQMALVDIAERKYKDAEETDTRLRASRRSGIAVVKGLVQAYTAQGKLDRAAEILNQELKQSPESGEIRELLGENATLAGKPAEAVHHYRAAVAQNAVSADLRFRLANALYSSGDIPASIAQLEIACERSPRNAIFLLALGSVLEQTDRREQAIQRYQAAVDADPKNAFALNNLAYNIAESERDIEKALTYVQRALEIIPSQPSFLDTLGWIYLKKGMTDTALQIFSQLVQRHPDSAITRYHYAVALLEKGNRTKARTELQAALGHKLTAGEALKIRELIQKVGSGS